MLKYLIIIIIIFIVILITQKMPDIPELMNLVESSEKFTKTNIIHKINNIFDQVYLINLKTDENKLRIMEEKFKKYNIKFKLFPGIDGRKIKNIKLLRYGNKGAVGIKRTQIDIIKDAMKNRYKRILICEDDLIFRKNFLYEFDNSYKQIIKKNNNWNLLYLGCSYKSRFNSQNKYFIKAKKSYGNFAVGVDESVYKTILTAENDNRPIDDIFVEDIQKNKKFKSIVFNPMVIVADVRKPSKTDGLKDISGWYYNHNDIIKKEYNF